MATASSTSPSVATTPAAGPAAGSPSPLTGPMPKRVESVDAYRGLVMVLMMGEVLSFHAVHNALPHSRLWAFLHHHQSHVDWVGCSLHDLIQPSFSFLVGVALPFSIASRLARGSTWGRMFAHAVWRAFLLVVLGIFLRSIGRPQTYFTFEDTLTQIGLGYVFLFLLGFRSPRVQWSTLVFIQVGYWAAFALYPLPGANFDWSQAGVAANWEHNLTGFAAHWNKNTNLAWAFDRWFLNLFPRQRPFLFNGGGYATLSFIPTLGTMILGLIAGGWLKASWPNGKRIATLVAAGAGCMALGWSLDALGICPNVKRIWTPSWTLFSGGWCFFLLAGFYAVIDAIGLRAWSFPLRVVGMNSIAAYLIAHLFVGFIESALHTHLGDNIFLVFGTAYEQLIQGILVLGILWLVLFWMFRRRLFLKI